MDLISKMASTPPGVAAVYMLEALSGQVPVDGPSRICLGKTSCSQKRMPDVGEGESRSSRLL
jgi:hypothetical protein